MKGYKAFDKDLKCRNKQYEIGKTYEEKDISLCKKGLHFCENPLDTLNYYDLCDSRFGEVEAENVSDEKENDSKRVAKKLTIKTELSLKGFIDAAINFLFEKTEIKSNEQAASGYYSKLAASGYYSKLAASGDYSKLAASGDSSQLAASGDSSKLAASGDSSQLAASGDYSKLAASGDSSQLAASGKNSIACSIGYKGMVKASLNSWIVLSEFDDDNNIVCVKSAKIDGKKLKADTWYKLENKRFIEI